MKDTLNHQASLAAADSDLLLRSLPVGVIFQNARGEIVAANAAAERLLGVPAEQLRGTNFSDRRWRALRPDGSALPESEQPERVALATGQPVRNVAMAVFNPARNAHVLITLDAIPAAIGPGAGGVYSLLQEFAEPPAAVEPGPAGVERLRAIFDSIFTYFALLDHDGNILEVNRAPLDRGGYRREELLGRYFPDTPWWTYDAAVRGQLVAAIREAAAGRASRYEVRVDMGGELASIDFQISPVHGKAGTITHLLATAVDITERRQAEAALRESKKRLSDREEVLRLFIDHAPPPWPCSTTTCVTWRPAGGGGRISAWGMSNSSAATITR